MHHISLAFRILSFVVILLRAGVVQTQKTTHRVSPPTSAPNAIHDGSLIYVKDSGICETTPGVHQVSGYINVSKNTYLWFWFFEARKSPDTAPLTVWMNGGPGCSAMMGLFQENGPCQVDVSGKTTKLNPYSWNNITNMLYIDVPVGSGFSHGTDRKDTVQGTAKQTWSAFQMLFESREFSRFRDRRLIFATESFGARLGPAFIRYFNRQNEKIDKGETKGHKVVFSSILMNNGKHDLFTQMDSLVRFAADAPGYGRLQNHTVVHEMKHALEKPDGCLDSLRKCEYDGGSSTTCKKAYVFCTRHVLSRAIKNRFSTDLTRNETDPPFPHPYYLDYIRSPEVMAKIGATSKYDQCNHRVKSAFIASGDAARSGLGDLAALADAKFPILIWVGDYDIKCNWIGVHDSMVSMSWYGNQTLNSTHYSTITVGNKAVAAAKVVNNFSFVRVYRAGHALPAYQPEAAQAIFQEFVQKENLLSMVVGTQGHHGAHKHTRKMRRGW